MEVSAFMTEQLDKQLEKQRMHDAQMRDQMDAKMERQLEEAKREKADLKAEMEAKLEKQRGEADALKNDQQLAALQARLEALHAAKLLADEDLFALEDVIADALEAPDRALRMVALSARMVADASFSRQLRRKFIA